MVVKMRLHEITNEGKSPHKKGTEPHRKHMAAMHAGMAEEAKSKAQQRFMGMVHAVHKGEKPASPEIAKVAKSMKKKDADDFASTKHKGLPNHV